MFSLEMGANLKLILIDSYVWSWSATEGRGIILTSIRGQRPKMMNSHRNYKASERGRRPGRGLAREVFK